MRISTISVVFLVPRIDGKTGGMERQALHLASTLRTEGCRIFLVTCAYWDWMRDARLPLTGAVDEFTVYRVPIFRGWRRLNAVLYFFGALFFLVLWRSRYAIIHAHELHSSGPIACACKALMPSKKVLIKATSAGRWMGDLANLGRLPAAWWVRGFVKRHADMIVGVSPEVIRELADAGFAPLQLIPNGVDTELFAPLGEDARRELKEQLLGDRSDAPVVLFVGRLGPEKNLPVLLDAMARLAVAAHLLIVGDGDLGAELKRRTSDAGLDRTVIFWGAAERIERFYQIADVFVLPSLTEGSPNVLLEAMSCGVPCVGSDIPGIRAVITDGVNGRIFSRDAEELAGIVRGLLSDRALSGRFSQAARHHALETFGLDRTASEYVALYRRLECS